MERLLTPCQPGDNSRDLVSKQEPITLIGKGFWTCRSGRTRAETSGDWNINSTAEQAGGREGGRAGRQSPRVNDGHEQGPTGLPATGLRGRTAAPGRTGPHRSRHLYRCAQEWGHVPTRGLDPPWGSHQRTRSSHRSWQAGQEDDARSSQLWTSNLVSEAGMNHGDNSGHAAHALGEVLLAAPERHFPACHSVWGLGEPPKWDTARSPHRV